MKAGEKDRVGALRLVLSELQKAAKEGDGDELAVLRRERKRRPESARGLPRRRAATSWPSRRRPRPRSSRPTCRPSCPTTSCARSSPTPSPRPARASPKDMGQVMKAAMAKVGGRADGKRVSALVQEALRLMRRQIELSNEVAAALAASGDAILRALEGHVDCDLFLRGNVVTLDGDAEAVARRRGRRARAGRARRAGPRDRARARSRR